jgi:hypothetical protein
MWGPVGNWRFSRRLLLSLPALVAGLGRGHIPVRAQADSGEIAISAASNAPGVGVFNRDDFGNVGVFDVDWLTHPGFERLFDNLAASPGAFHGVRFFGAFTAGTPELLAPEGGGNVWPRIDAPIDFSVTLDALAALTTRGLTPFIALGFFPPAVSASPIQPPKTWDAWKTLVRSFLETLVADKRFGPNAIAEWWLEVWNEPNEGRFWQGTSDDYFALYQATSEAVAEAGVAIRLGGPAIAYKPQVEPESGAPWIDRFLRFIAADPTLQCDFISLHRKGTVGDDPPDPRRLYVAASAKAEQALAIDPTRFRGISIINDEADEKVGFEVPYASRMDERNAAWLAASMIIQTALNQEYSTSGLRFFSAADNANLQLVQAPFDGRRSIMTKAVAGTERDLLKIPAYGFYELLRLQGERQLPVVSGAEFCFPETDLFHLSTIGEADITTLLAYYPDPNVERPEIRTHALVVTDISWSHVNIARFQIDRTHSNAYAAAGGSSSNPYPSPDPSQLPAIRLAQEISLARPIARNIVLQDGRFSEAIEIKPYTTLCLWITPVLDTAPQAPVWIELNVEDGNVILRWEPNREPFFFSYEVFLIRDGVQGERLTPDPLRAAFWIDTKPPTGRRTYGVRAISASGVASELVIGPEVAIEEG